MISCVFISDSFFSFMMTEACRVPRLHSSAAAATLVAQCVRRYLYLFILWVLLGCTPDIEFPLRIGSNQWIGYEPVYLARTLNWLPEDKVRLVEMRSATQVLDQIMAGNLEGGMLTLDEVLTLLEKGVDMKIVTLMDFSDGADVLIARSGMRLEDLEGKRIGVENTAVGAILLDAALQEAELTLAEIQIISVQVDDHAEVFQQRIVDAIVTFEPTRSVLLNSGAAQVYDSSRIPGRIIDVLAIRKDVLNRQAENVSILLAAYFKALEYLSENPEQGYADIAPRLHLPVEDVRASYAGIKMLNQSMTRDWMNCWLDQQASDLNRLMVDRGLMGSVVDVNGLSEPAFLPGQP